MKKFALALAAFGLAAGFTAGVSAETLPAYRGQKIDLGGVSGTAYYTVEQGGYRVVATLADSGSNVTRMEAVLAPGQSIVLSAPGAVGMPPARIEITRHENEVEVQKATVTN